MLSQYIYFNIRSLIIIKKYCTLKNDNDGNDDCTQNIKYICIL